MSCWGNILQNTERLSLMTLSISTLSWSILCQTLAGSETDKKSVRDKIMTLLGFSLSKWRLLIGRCSPTLASDWPEHGTQILSDKLVQLGPAALTDEGKNCQSRFNFYYLHAFLFQSRWDTYIHSLVWSFKTFAGCYTIVDESFYWSKSSVYCMSVSVSDILVTILTHACWHG